MYELQLAASECGSVKCDRDLADQKEAFPRHRRMEEEKGQFRFNSVSVFFNFSF